MALETNVELFMAFGFDTGSTWFDRYMEAYWEVVGAYYQSLGVLAGMDYYRDVFEATVVPAIREAVQSTKGVYAAEYLDQYYESVYKNYFNENPLEAIFSGYDVAGVDVGKILAKWGFTTADSPEADSFNSFGLDLPERFARKSLDPITNFDPDRDTLGLDGASWGLDAGAFSFASASKKKVVKRLAKSDVHFIYLQPKGMLYCNENGADKGFGNGGLCAVFEGTPVLSQDIFTLL
jgi:hypothetical protein